MRSSKPLLALVGLAVVVLAALAVWLLLDEGDGGGAEPEVVAPQETTARGAPDVPEPAADDAGGPASAESIDARRPTAAVKGRVLGPDHEPVAGALAHLFRDDGTLPMRPRPSTGLSVATGADGVFLLEDIPVGGDLGVEVSHADHAPALHAPFTPRTGELVDLGDILLVRGLTLMGTIRDIEKDPIAGAEIRLLDLTHMPAPGDVDHSVRTTLSEADGTYAIHDLAMRRQYQVWASAEGFATQRTVISFVLQLPENHWTLDFTLREADVELGGWVLDEDSRPVAGAALKITQRHRGRNTYFEAETVTGDDGGFWFEAVPRDTYSLDLTADDAYLSSRPELESGRTDHTVWVLPALSVHCRLVSDRTLPERFDLRIQPENASGAGTIPGAPLQRRYDDPHDFVVDGLMPGSYHFEVTVPGFAVTRSQTLIIDDSVRDAVLDIHLSDGGTITGRVAGAPPGTAVELRGAHYDPKLPIEGVFPTKPVHGLATRTDDEGAFELPHVPEGDYTLSVVPAARPPLHVRDVEVVEDGLTDLGELRLIEGGDVAGVVLDEFGAPATGVRVTLMSDDHYRRLITDDAGRFAVRGLPPGRYAVTASPTTFEEALRLTASDRVEVVAGAEASLQLMFEELYPPGPPDG